VRRKHWHRAGTLALARLTFAATVAAGALASGSASGNTNPQPICVPSPEVCDGFDNDCDGTVDNGNPGGTIPCITGLLGACGPGTLTCVDGSLQCVPELLPGEAPEICDEVDNDCDGAVDDGYGTGTPCEVGSGACLRDGWIVCSSTGGTLCNAVAGTGDVEKCDGVDNDCDGEIDDGNPGGGETCDTGMAGVCAPGVTFCSKGAMLCVTAPIPGDVIELCDGFDNDCDGAIDDGDPGGGDPCESGLPGACGPGVLHCVGAQILCVPATSPGALVELCGDAEDSDCDGLTDNGCGGAGGAGGGTGEGGAGGDTGEGAGGCVDDADCEEGATCEIDAGGFGTCEPSNGLDDRPYGAMAGCACTTAPGREDPLDLFWGALAAVTALVAASRPRRRRPTTR
jgi:hypothetical protein